MSLSYLDAKDQLFTRAKNVLGGSDTNTLLGYVPDVRWQGVPTATVPDKSKLWARVSSQVVTDGQAALANANGKRLFEAAGLLYIQLFCPKGEAGIPAKGLLLAIALQAQYRQQSSSAELWFRNQRILELPETADSYPINVVTEFRYKTLQPSA